MSPHSVPVILNSSDTKPWDSTQDSADRGLMLADLEEAGFWSRNSLVQIIYGLWANQVVLCTGLAFGFSLVTFPQIKVLSSADTWMSILIILMSSAGCIFCGYSMDRLGRREMMVLSMLPLAVGWMLTGFAEDPQDMIYGRFITGIGVGMAAIPPRAYCIEIALPKMRGVLGALHTLALVTGIFLQAIFYHFLSWKITCFICSVHAIVIMLLNVFLPETPYFVLLKNKNIFHVKDALEKFRAESYDSEPELQDLIIFRKRNRIRKLTFSESLKHSCRCDWCKALAILLLYSIIVELSGCAVFKYWPVDMFMELDPKDHSFQDTICYGLLKIFASALAMICFFYAHRRQLAIAASVALTLFYAMLSLYLMTTSKIVFIPKFVFMLVVVAGAFGPYSLPMLMIFEVIPLQLRGVIGSIATAIHLMTVFAVLLIYPHVRKWIGYPHLLLLYGLVSFVGAIFVYFLLPETYGLSLIDIQSNIMTKHRTEVFMSQSNINSESIEEDITAHKRHSKSKSHVTISTVLDEESQTDKTNQTDTGVSAQNSKSLIK